MNVMRRPVLQLNASYEALRIIPAMRALKLVTTGKATVELATKKLVYPGIYLPSVIRLLVYRHVPVRLQVTTRRNILMRDSYRCQYCGQKFHGSELTLDHVIPRAQGGKNSWENLVACCRKDNHRKADRTPDEAGSRCRGCHDVCVGWFWPHLQLHAFRTIRNLPGDCRSGRHPSQSCAVCVFLPRCSLAFYEGPAELSRSHAYLSRWVFTTHQASGCVAW